MPNSHSQPLARRVPAHRAGPAEDFKAVNRDKFTTPESPFLPQLIQAWKDALTTLATQYPNIDAVDHPNRNLLRGYYFPDPFMFLKNGSELDNATCYLAAWDSMRTDWMSRIVGLNQSEMAVKIPQLQH